MKKIFLYTLISLFSLSLTAQEEMLKGIEDSIPAREKVTGAFKSTRVINAHSIEMLAKHNLDFRIMHRFGFVSDGVKQFFGLDAASFRMSFDYGITDNLTVGIGRSTFRKELDLFLKSRLIEQSRGQRSVPVSVVIAAGTMVFTEQSFAPVKPGFSDRTAYYFQLLVGRKFGNRFSFQLSPIVVHSNMPVNVTEDKTIFAAGGGGRFKFSKRAAFTFDYHHPFGKLDAIYTSPLSVGIDIETGGHVFQLQFSNATGMNERAYVTETTGKFFRGDIRFGFNLSRMFKVGKPR
ncbi:MAG: DUF5777 family beta-barrel protein [Ferruginibacter sp.]